MPRLRQVPRAEATPEVLEMYDRLFPGRDPVTEPGTATGTPGNWWTVFAIVPDIFNHAVAGFGLFSSPNRKLDPKHRELGLTRAGFARGSQFVFSQHSKASRNAGLSDAQVAAVPAWQTSDAFSPDERAVLAYTDEIVLADGRVQDATFDALREHLSEEAVLELTYAVANYALHATICRALRLEYDDIDERIVEVPVPTAGTGASASQDIMGDISRSSD